MELPPYHKPAFRNILYVTFQRTLDIFLRALRVISLVSIVFFVLTYGFGGSVESSILYKVGVVIDPVTRFFGLKWQAFLAFCASAISKESLLGVLNTLYGAGGSLVISTFGAKVSAAAASGISEILAANFTKAEGLAFIFAISFNMPCVSALAATARETQLLLSSTLRPEMVLNATGSRCFFEASITFHRRSCPAQTEARDPPAGKDFPHHRSQRSCHPPACGRWDRRSALHSADLWSGGTAILPSHT